MFYNACTLDSHSIIKLIHIINSNIQNYTIPVIEFYRFTIYTKT